MNSKRQASQRLGITPIIATYLIAANGNQPWYLCAYVVFAALISAACAAAIQGSKLPTDNVGSASRATA